MSKDVNDRPDETTMADVSHTHPHTGETFGSVYRRGPAVADGGRDDESDSETMRDVDHTPPHGENTNDMWTRGRGRETDTDGDAESVRDGGEVADE